MLRWWDWDALSIFHVWCVCGGMTYLLPISLSTLLRFRALQSYDFIDHVTFDLTKRPRPAMLLPWASPIFPVVYRAFPVLSPAPASRTYNQVEARGCAPAPAVGLRPDCTSGVHRLGANSVLVPTARSVPLPHPSCAGHAACSLTLRCPRSGSLTLARPSAV